MDDYAIVIEIFVILGLEQTTIIMNKYQWPTILNVLIVIYLFMSCNHSKPSPPPIKKQADITSKVNIEYIAHASFKLTYNNHTLLLDPFADSVWISYFFPRDIQADAIFSTHPHYDHDGGIFRDLKPYWEGTIPFYQNPGAYQIGEFKIAGIKGKHSDPYGKEFGQKNTIFIFEVGGLRIAHWGDNAPLNDTLVAALKDIDILMFPIDDSYHILSREDTDYAISTIQPKVVIPMHYKITELEPFIDKPKNLESIDNFIKVSSNAIILNSHQIEVSDSDLPSTFEYWIFNHAPYVQGPGHQ